jgi:hypothetical protein
MIFGRQETCEYGAMSSARKVVAGRLVRFRDLHSFPGWAEVSLDLSDGSNALLVDKLPVFGIDSGDGPEVLVDCDVIATTETGTLTIKLAHGIETEDGLAVFSVRAEDVCDRYSG